MTDQPLYELLDDPEGGPVSMAELCRMAQAGEITRYSLLREGEGVEWVKAEQVEGLDFDGSPAAQPAPAHVSPEESWPDEPPSTTSDDAVPAPKPRRRFRLWFTLATLAVVVIGPALAWYLFRPTPVQRFVRFAEAAREELAGKLEAGAKQKFRDYFQYDVTKTDSLISPYRGTIVFSGGDFVANYAYEYRNGKWVCMAANLRPRKGNPVLLRGADLLSTPSGKVLTTCNRY